MKTRFFLCIRPPVIETDDQDYIKPPSPLSGKISRRHNRDLQQRKRVAPEKFKYIRQLSLKSSGNMSDEESENQAQKDSQKGLKIPRSASEACILKSSSDHEESVCWKTACNKQTNIPSKIFNSISNHKVSGGSNSGAYLMVSSLFFTILLGKLLGILCTLVLVCSLYRHVKSDGKGGWKAKNMVVKLPERGSPEHNKRVIMDGLLERKSHCRVNYTLFS